MNTKLHINLSQGIIDIEGDPELVRSIYDDFKGQLLESLKSGNGASFAEEQGGSIATEIRNESPAKPKLKRRSSPKKKANGDEGSHGISPDNPKLDKQLDLAGLADFYNQFEPKNNFEKILIFLKFMTENLSIDSPNSDQVFTCFKSTGEKIPTAFAQALRDTSKKHGFIDYNSPIDMPITIAGENHFNHNLKRKASE